MTERIAMTETIRTEETYRGPVRISFDGHRWLTTEQTVIGYSAIRDTPLGPIDFGHSYIMPMRWVDAGPVQLNSRKKWYKRLFRL